MPVAVAAEAMVKMDRDCISRGINGTADHNIQHDPLLARPVEVDTGTG